MIKEIPATPDETLLYTDPDGVLYEAKIFSDYALVRPADYARYSDIEQVKISDFRDRYKPALVSFDAVKQALGKKGSVN